MMIKVAGNSRLAKRTKRYILPSYEIIRWKFCPEEKDFARQPDRKRLSSFADTQYHKFNLLKYRIVSRFAVCPKFTQRQSVWKTSAEYYSSIYLPNKTMIDPAREGLRRGNTAAYGRTGSGIPSLGVEEPRVSPLVSHQEQSRKANQLITRNPSPSSFPANAMMMDFRGKKLVPGVVNFPASACLGPINSIGERTITKHCTEYP